MVIQDTFKAIESNLYLAMTYNFLDDMILNFSHLDKEQFPPEDPFLKYLAFEEHHDRELAAGKGST